LQKNPQIRAEDIRSMLPHSVLTHVFWQINLRALLGIYENRFCCQAEATVWLPLLIDIRKKIKAWNPRIEALISSPYERGENCGYNSSLDRPCAWRKAGTWNL
jgi:thymidylate synthase ThyX